MQKIDTILGYEMRTLLGKGSFSEVYEARKGDKLVAIKLMKPPLTTDNRGLLDILRYEFWLLKDLTHPHIVRVFDFGQLEDGRFYLIEEYVAGVPLDVFCQRPFRDCEPIFTQILQGLAELESCGIVHGDIKPANILVTEIEKTPSAKILDFGMAHLKQKALFGGTPSTMAPEVILHQNSDHRSDLYSLGVTFYTCLSGKNPLLGKDVNETCTAHLHKKVDPIGLIRHDIPPEWAALIHHFLEKNPDDRPSSAIKTLSLIQKNHFVLSPTSLVGRKQELNCVTKIKEALVSGKKMALVVQGAPGVGVSRFLREVFYQLIAAHADLREHITLVEGPTDHQTKVLLIERAAAPPNYPTETVALAPLTPAELRLWLELIFDLKKIPQTFLEKIATLTAGHAQSVWGLLTVLHEKKQLVDAAGHVTPATLALMDWDTVLPDAHVNGELEQNIHWLFSQVKRRIQARNLLQQDPIWAKLEQLLSREPQETIRLTQRAEYLALKGEALIDEGQLLSAKEALTAALEIFKNTAGRKVDEWRVRNFLSYILLRQGKPHEAVIQFETTWQEAQTSLTAEDLQKITNLDLGLAYVQNGDFHKAIARLKEELAFHEAHSADSERQGTMQIRQIGCLYNLAQSYSALGDLENAKRFYHQVILRARAQREHAYLLRGLNGLGNVLRNSDMWGEAVHSYTEALELALALSDFGSAAAAAQNRGVLAGTHGLYQNAIRDLTDSLHYVSRITTHYSFEKTLACRSHVELGKIFISLKRFDAAQDELDRAWHMAEKDPDLTDFRFWVLHARCRLWQACGDTERLKQDLGKLPFYANTDEKRKKLYEVEPPTTAVLASSQTVAATEFEFLIKLTHDLLSETQLPELLKKILSSAIQLCQAELGVLLLTDDHGRLTPAVSLNADLNDALREISLTVAQQVVSTGQIINVQDATTEEPFAQNASVMAFNLRSIIGLPVTFRGKVLGVLYLSHRYHLGLFDERLQKILSVFADQAGLALTNHQLLEFHRAAEEKALVELNDTRRELTVVQEKIRSLPESLRERVTMGPLKTRSKAVFDILSQVERIAATTLPLLIHGETGTGKELLARYAHDASPRKSKPFIAINCGALPAALVESELFGHVKGAFTGAYADQVGLIEAAHGGTIFLDEITDLPLEAQVKLLRVLQEREVQRLGERAPRKVDIRLITAAQKSLREAVATKKFREDLYFRLMGLELTLPPLRERPEDILLLAEFFLKDYLRQHQQKEPAKISAPFLKLLTRYPWPGNIRELQGVIFTAAALSEGKILTVEALPKNLRDLLTGVSGPKSRVPDLEKIQPLSGWYHEGLNWQGHLLLIYASSLIALKFNIPRVAASLGVGVSTVFKWVREHRLRETIRDWEKKTLPYQEGTRLDHIQAEIFAQISHKFPGHPYRAAHALDVAPATFYRWCKPKSGS